jgi:hypothetical protein
MEITLDGTVDSQLAHVHLENFYIAPPKDTYQTHGLVGTSNQTKTI